jgi:hypothetical protein
MIILIFSVSNFQKAQGIDLATMRYLSMKYHLANTGMKMQTYGFGPESVIKFGRSFIQVSFSPFCNYYYPATKLSFTLLFMCCIPYILAFLSVTTRKVAFTALPFLFIPLIMHSGSYFPVIFSRHTYLPSAGNAMLIASVVFLFYVTVAARRAKLAHTLLAIICCYYLFHGIRYTHHDREFPMHKDALKRDKQITQLKKISRENGDPLMFCFNFPFPPPQFDAISSVFFNGRLIPGKNGEFNILTNNSSAVIYPNLSELSRIIVKFEKNSFRVMQ